MRVEWVFLCEAIETGPADEVVSIIRIIRPHSGFGARVLPFVVSPYFVLSMHGEPGEVVTISTSVADGMSPAIKRDLRMEMPASGMAEVAVPLGKGIFPEPWTFRFSLSVNGNLVLEMAVPLERKV